MSETLYAEIHKTSEKSPGDIKDYDLIGFGSGIYYGKHHKSLLKFVDGLDAKEMKTFIFSTSRSKKLPLINNFDKALTKRLTEKGFSILGSFNCRGLKAYYNAVIKVRPFCKAEESRPNQRDILKMQKVLHMI